MDVTTEREVARQSNLPEVITRLRVEAQINPAFRDVAHAFAVRQRARQQVTLARLTQAMQGEGFKHSKNDYKKVLEFLASIGIGQLDKDTKGRIRSLKGIRVTLQSVGLAAISKKETFDKFSPQARFINLPQVELPKASFLKTKKAKTPKVQPQAEERRYDAMLTVMIDGEKVDFQLPKLTMKDLSQVLLKSKGGRLAWIPRDK